MKTLWVVVYSVDGVEQNLLAKDDIFFRKDPAEETAENLVAHYSRVHPNEKWTFEIHEFARKK